MHLSFMRKVIVSLKTKNNRRKKVQESANIDNFYIQQIHSWQHFSQTHIHRDVRKKPIKIAAIFYIQIMQKIISHTHEKIQQRVVIKGNFCRKILTNPVFQSSVSIEDLSSKQFSFLVLRKVTIIHHSTHLTTNNPPLLVTSWWHSTAANKTQT